MKRLLPVLMMVFGVFLGSAGESESADFQKGLTAARSGDFTTALREFQPAAEDGDAKSQFALGWMYHEGKGVSQDYKTAVKWFTLAAKQGNARAQFNLGVTYEQGKGVPRDYKTAVKWYRLAAEQGVCRCPVQSGIDVRIWRGCSTRLHPCPYVVKYCRIIWEK